MQDDILKSAAETLSSAAVELFTTFKRGILKEMQREMPELGITDEMVEKVPAVYDTEYDSDIDDFMHGLRLQTRGKDNLPYMVANFSFKFGSKTGGPLFAHGIAIDTIHVQCSPFKEYGTDDFVDITYCPAADISNVTKVVNGYKLKLKEMDYTVNLDVMDRAQSLKEAIGNCHPDNFNAGDYVDTVGSYARCKMTVALHNDRLIAKALAKPAAVHKPQKFKKKAKR